LTQTWNLQIGAMTFAAVEVVWIFVPAVFHVMPIIDLLKKVRALERGAGIKEPEGVLR